MLETTDFKPNWLSAPSDTILDILEEKGVALEWLLERAGRERMSIQSIIDGEVITGATAKSLASLLGGTETFWLKRDEMYRYARVRECNSETTREWLAGLPLKDMRRFGWMPKGRDPAEACLRFFGFSTIAAWKEHQEETLQATAFRTSPTFASSLGAVAAWIRRGEMLAKDIECRPWDPGKLRDFIPELRGLTRMKDPNSFLPKIVEYCAACGVAAVVVRAPTGCAASGVTRFITEHKALLMLSFRYLSEDHFWFTFFHELGHLSLHGRRQVYLETADCQENREEEEANQFAADALVPQRFSSALKELPRNYKDLIRFARLIGISPGIVVGQLQHAGLLRHDQMNYLKRRYRWSSVNL